MYVSSEKMYLKNDKGKSRKAPQEGAKASLGKGKPHSPKGKKLGREGVISMFKDYNKGATEAELAERYGISIKSVKERLRDFALMRDIALQRKDTERLGESGDVMVKEDMPPQGEVDKPLEVPKSETKPPGDVPSVSEIEMGVKGVGQKESFSPTTLLLYSYLNHLIEKDARLKNEEFEPLSFGEMTDYVFKTFCQEHRIEIAILKSGVSERVTV